MTRIRSIQKALAPCSSSFLVHLEAALLIELKKLLDDEELLCRQKSHIDWITEGDRNTHYFHHHAIRRKQRNRISSLKFQHGEWCDDDQTLQEEVVCYFAGLFLVDSTDPSPFPTMCAFPSISQDSMHTFDYVSSNQEIYNSLKEIMSVKSPG
ncbi:hypothetical protein V6N13_029741 [Hibiscus sabdariffa]